MARPEARFPTTLALLALPLLLASCGELLPPAGKAPNPTPIRTSDHTSLSEREALALPEEDPSITGPHGGMLVLLERKRTFLEIDLDPELGRLRVYLLDGMKEGLRECKEDELTIEIALESTGSHLGDTAARLAMESETAPSPLERRSLTLRLARFMPLNDGRELSRGVYTATSRHLSGLNRFRGRIERITIDDLAHRNVEFRYRPPSER